MLYDKRHMHIYLGIAAKIEILCTGQGGTESARQGENIESD